MAKQTVDTEATYTEEMTARVNAEGNTHEVILRGVDSANTLHLSNQRGAKGFNDNSRYRVAFTEIPATEYAPKPSADDVAAAKATLEAAESAAVMIAVGRLGKGDE